MRWFARCFAVALALVCSVSLHLDAERIPYPDRSEPSIDVRPYSLRFHPKPAAFFANGYAHLVTKVNLAEHIARLEQVASLVNETDWALRKSNRAHFAEYDILRQRVNATRSILLDVAYSTGAITATPQVMHVPREKRHPSRSGPPATSAHVQPSLEASPVNASNRTARAVPLVAAAVAAFDLIGGAIGIYNAVQLTRIVAAVDDIKKDAAVLATKVKLHSRKIALIEESILGVRQALAGHTRHLRDHEQRFLLGESISALESIAAGIRSAVNMARLGKPDAASLASRPELEAIDRLNAEVRAKGLFLAPHDDLSLPRYGASLAHDKYGTLLFFLHIPILLAPEPSQVYRLSHLPFHINGTPFEFAIDQRILALDAAPSEGFRTMTTTEYALCTPGDDVVFCPYHEFHLVPDKDATGINPHRCLYAIWTGNDPAVARHCTLRPASTDVLFEEVGPAQFAISTGTPADIQVRCRSPEGVIRTFDYTIQSTARLTLPATCAAYSRSEIVHPRLALRDETSLKDIFKPVPDPIMALNASRFRAAAALHNLSRSIEEHLETIEALEKEAQVEELSIPLSTHNVPAIASLGSLAGLLGLNMVVLAVVCVYLHRRRHLATQDKKTDQKTDARVTYKAANQDLYIVNPDPPNTPRYRIAVPADTPEPVSDDGLNP